MFGFPHNEQALQVLALSASFQAMNEMSNVSPAQPSIPAQIDPETEFAPVVRSARAPGRSTSFSWFLRPITGSG